MIDEQELSLWIKRLEAEPSSWKTMSGCRSFTRSDLSSTLPHRRKNFDQTGHATPLENGFYQGRSGKMGGGVGKL